MDSDDSKKLGRILSELVLRPARDILWRTGLAVIPSTILWYLLAPSFGLQPLPFWKVHELLILVMVVSKMLKD